MQHWTSPHAPTYQEGQDEHDHSRIADIDESADAGRSRAMGEDGVHDSGQWVDDEAGEEESE